MLTIATVNVQYKYKLKHYDGIRGKEDHVKLLMNLIQKYHIQIIGLQEVNQKYAKRLQESLLEKMVYYGPFRYPLNFFTKHCYPFTVFNESTPIITDQEVLTKRSVILPWLSSYVPRIVTIMEV